MADQDARELLEKAGIEPTACRLRVLEAIAASPAPLQAQEILDIFPPERAMNRVTLYRILDLLVEKELVWRHSGGDRVFRYCLADRSHGVRCHFYCTSCREMRCLRGSQVPDEVARLKREGELEVHSVEIRLDGVCEECRGG
ncbi:MAG: Fur family transcriptional regulator [Desulfohalobiaceae bacterium]